MTDDQPTDEHLMVDVQAGKPEALDRLLVRHGPALHGYLYRMNGNAADADELCQEAFLKVWQHAWRWQPRRATFTTWLFRIGHNLWIDRYRKQLNVAAENAPDVEAIGADPDLLLAAEQRHRAVRAAVAELPERQRAALLLCQFQGLSNSQAAAVLELSVHALESLLARGRRSLRQRLQHLATPAGTDP